jgi:hypothetical protein
MSHEVLTDALAVVHRVSDHLDAVDVERLRMVLRQIQTVLDQKDENKKLLVIRSSVPQS